jgi:hypothetical protein
MRRLTCLAVIAMITTLASAQSRGGTAPRARSTVRLMNTRVPEITFESVPFEQVMDWIADLTGINVVVRWQQLEEYGIERDKPVSLKARNLKLSQVLWMIMNEAGGPEVKLAYRATGELLILSTHEDLGKDMIVKVYDVSDLLVRIPRFTNAAQLNPGQALNQAGQGGQGGGGGGGGGGGQLFQDDEEQGGDEAGDQGNAQADMQRLITVITDTIEPDSWVTAGGLGNITPLRNQIIVRNSILVHQLLGGMMEEDEIAR